MEAGAELSDDAYIPGPGESSTVQSEEEGCDGEPAVLQLAYWEDAFGDDPPVVITEDLVGFQLEHESLGRDHSGAVAGRGGDPEATTGSSRRSRRFGRPGRAEPRPRPARSIAINATAATTSRCRRRWDSR